MSDLSFDDDRWLHLLWVVLAVGAVGVYGIWQRRRGLQRFAAAALVPRLAAGPGLLRMVLRLGLVCMGLAALVAALIGPRWGTQMQQLIRRNIDVLVLLDVSRSMLAQDIAPNRLERAKLAIRDDLLPALGGDRIGLIAFAGKPSVACPLTTDYGFFRLALDDVSIRSAPLGGTLIGDAIRKAGELFEREIDTHKLIILITDGEDHESLPVAAAGAVWEEQRIPIIALALGDDQEGARIPVASGRGDGWLEYRGEVVRSKADFATLERVAAASSTGLFIGVGTSNFDLGEIFRRVAGDIRAHEETSAQRIQRPSRYQGFAIVALVLVLIDSCLRDGPRRALAVVGMTGLRGRAALVFVALLLTAGRAWGGEAEDLARRGESQYAAGDYAAALESFRAASELAGVDPAARAALLHNEAAAHFRLGQIEEARDLWSRVKALRDAGFEARTEYNLGNCDYADALQAYGQQDLQAAGEHVAAALEKYRQALRLDPGLNDARANLELAHLLKKQLDAQLQQSQQPDQSQQKGEQNEENQQQQPSSQPSESQESESQPSDQQQSEPQPQSRPSDSQEQEEEESESQPPQEQPESEQEQPQENASTGDQPESQPAASQPEQAEQPPEDELPHVRMTRAQAERLLQMVRDAEKQRREALARRRAGGRPVERDW